MQTHDADQLYVNLTFEASSILVYVVSVRTDACNSSRGHGVAHCALLGRRAAGIILRAGVVASLVRACKLRGTVAVDATFRLVGSGSCIRKSKV